MTQEIRPSIDWALEFRRLVDEIIRNNEVSLAAIEAIEAIGHCRDDSVPNASDAPAQAIAQIVAANNQLKMQALGMLQTVIEMQLQERGPSAD